MKGELIDYDVCMSIATYVLINNLYYIIIIPLFSLKFHACSWSIARIIGKPSRNNRDNYQEIQNRILGKDFGIIGSGLLAGAHGTKPVVTLEFWCQCIYVYICIQCMYDLY